MTAPSWDHARSVLAVRLDTLGDVLMTTPAIRALSGAGRPARREITLLTSPAGDAYELRGPRLVLKAGAFSFDEKGGTETAKTFAKNFSAKITQLATVTPLYADLQNVADMSVVAALIRKDCLLSQCLKQRFQTRLAFDPGRLLDA